MAIFSSLMVAILLAQSTLGQQFTERNKLLKESISHLKMPRPHPIPEMHPASGEYPCPDAEAILPCACSYDDDIFVACSNVTSEQLAQVFQQEFPVKDIDELFIFESPLLTSLDFDLNGVTLRILRVVQTPVAAIDPEFLKGSYETLDYLSIDYSELSTEGFIFDDLANYVKLGTILLYYNNMDTIPPIYSPSLFELDIAGTSVSEILPGTFDGAPLLTSFFFNDNDIVELAEGTIPFGTEPSEVSLNTLERIIPGAFYATSANASMTSYMLSGGKLTELLPNSIPIGSSTSIIDLGDNEIMDVQPGAFSFLGHPYENEIDLLFHHNQLTVLEEDVFGPLMTYIDHAFFDDNPLICGCDIAWLLRSRILMSKISPKTTCADGTLIHDLDAEDYQDC